MPKINSKSRSIMISKGRDIYQTEQNLINYGKMRDESLKQKKIEKEHAEATVCILELSCIGLQISSNITSKQAFE